MEQKRISKMSEILDVFRNIQNGVNVSLSSTDKIEKSLNSIIKENKDSLQLDFEYEDPFETFEVFENFTTKQVIKCKNCSSCEVYRDNYKYSKKKCKNCKTTNLLTKNLIVSINTELYKDILALITVFYNKNLFVLEFKSFLSLNNKEDKIYSVDLKEYSSRYLKPSINNEILINSFFNEYDILKENNDISFYNDEAFYLFDKINKISESEKKEKLNSEKKSYTKRINLTELISIYEEDLIKEHAAQIENKVIIDHNNMLLVSYGKESQNLNGEIIKTENIKHSLNKMFTFRDCNGNIHEFKQNHVDYRNTISLSKHTFYKKVNEGVYIGKYELLFNTKFKQVSIKINYSILLTNNGKIKVGSRNNNLHRFKEDFLDDLLCNIDPNTKLFFAIKSAKEIPNGSNGTFNEDFFEVYLNKFLKFPIIENLQKIGLKKLCRNLIYEKNESLEGKNFYDLIGFKDKKFLDLALKINVELIQELKFLSQLWILTKGKHPEEIEYIYNQNTGFNIYNRIIEMLNIKNDLKKIIDYQKECLNYQCITFVNWVTEYSDYLKLATMLDYDLKNKRILFPDSLRKEHDIATFSFNTIKEEKSSELFTNAVKKLKIYEFSNKDFSVIAPTKPNDLIREGKSLNHCVGSYVSRISNLETSVLFVRATENIDEPLCTIEVSNNMIVQAKCHSNTKPNKSINDFIKTFAKNKNLTINY